MGRKIPGRKHHGVRDIEKQRQLKLLSLKNKINAPPANSDDQYIPKSLSHLIELKEKVRSGEIGLKRKRKFKMTLTPAGLPSTKQRNKPSNFRKLNVDIAESDKSSSDSSDNDEEADEDILRKYIREEDKSKGDGQKNMQRLTKSQKWQRKLKERKLKKAGLHVDDDFKNFRDEVKFGETVHAPPTLTAPRKVSSKETPRPGKKNLLLKSMIENAVHKKNSDQKRIINNKVKAGSNKIIDRKAKRKHMPHALRRQMDKQQEDVMKAYKLLKSKKYNSNSRQ